MAEAEWELSKENVQPLRHGRVMSTLQEVLSQQEGASHTVIQQQKQAFELELRFYTGDDPLDVWDRYIKWAEQAFPQGGKESNLSPLLERAVKNFHEEKQYYEDLRYLSICLKFANFCTDPLDLYSYLHSQGIGVLHALLYITWAEEYEAQGNYKKADSIFQEGIQQKAEPIDKLEAHHRQFQARVSRQVLQGISEGADVEESEVAEPPRNSLVDLKCRGKNKAKAPVSRVGDITKSRRPGFGVQGAPPPQIPNRSCFAVFDENTAISASLEQPMLNQQPWPALPPARAKENDQKAGPWNSARSSRRNQQEPSSELLPSVPSFTPYVDNLAEQQLVTPCKINPTITSVLSSRKPGKEENPLHRVQNHSQGKDEMVMYCKSKVYAGMEEFSFEEIRAEMYWAKVRKKREEDLLAGAQRRQEMERQIEQMERLLKETVGLEEEKMHEQASQDLSSPVPFNKESVPPPHREGEQYRYLHSPDTKIQDTAVNTASTHELPGNELLSGQNEWQNPASTSEIYSLLRSTLDLAFPLSSEMPFTIFDESATEPSTFPENSVHPPVCRRLQVPRRQAMLEHDQSLLNDVLDGTEPLNEDAIVCGSYKDKSLLPDPEDTCDFVRAAQLASTPFHKAKSEQSGQNKQSDLKRQPLGEKTPVCAESHMKEHCIKKLSPILEASREDARSSISSISSVSSGLNATSSFPSKTLPILNQFALTPEEPAQTIELKELQRHLLEPMYELLESVEIQHEVGQLPVMKDQQDVTLECETYSLKSEILLGEKSKLYMGIQADSYIGGMKGIALKVDCQPVPWDFYISLQLKERLGECFETNFLEQSNCYLYKDGCIMLYKDINCFSVQDILQYSEEVTVLVAYNLLNLVEKLHAVEIVHGNLRPETLLLDDRIFDLSSCTEMSGLFKLIDFSSSMDMRLCPTMNSNGFPAAQTKHGQRILASQTSAFQVDLFGIADVVHLMIFGKHLELHQDDSTWKVSREIPSTCLFGRLWETFFARILNADGECTASVLKELKGEMMQLFDRCFQEKICEYLIKMEMQNNV
ncbi:mitotic checkpoint serine/threonine-protein kinase BUB1 beta [Pelodytes ibericus]